MDPPKKLDIALYRELFLKFTYYKTSRHSFYPSVNLHHVDFVLNKFDELFDVNQNGPELSFNDYSVFVIGQEPQDLSEALIMKKRAWKKRLQELQPTIKRDGLLNFFF